MSGDGRVSEFHWDGVCQPASEAIEEVVFGCLRHGIKLPSTVGLSPRAFRAVYFCVRNDPRWFLRHPDGERLSIVLRNHGIEFTEDTASPDDSRWPTVTFAPGVTVNLSC